MSLASHIGTTFVDHFCRFRAWSAQRKSPPKPVAYVQLDQPMLNPLLRAVVCGKIAAGP